MSSILKNGYSGDNDTFPGILASVIANKNLDRGTGMRELTSSTVHIEGVIALSGIMVEVSIDRS